MRNRAPLTEGIMYGQPSTLSNGWISWFASIFQGLPWSIGFVKTATLDFGSIALQAQAGLTVTITGVRAGDAVQVTPTTDVSGIIFSGVVSASDTVTIYAKNLSSGAVDPPSQSYKILVLQG